MEIRNLENQKEIRTKLMKTERKVDLKNNEEWKMECRKMLRMKKNEKTETDAKL